MRLRSGLIRMGLSLTVFFVGLNALASPIDLVLKLKSRVPMSELARRVYDPSSTHFGRFYEPEEIAQIAGPTKEAYGALLAELKVAGFQIKAESPTRLVLSIQGESQSLKLLGTRSFSPLIGSVTGLDNRRHSRPHYRRADLRTQARGGIEQGTIKSAYGFSFIYDNGITGRGEHIAIATYDSFHIKNIEQFYKLSKLKPLPQVDQVFFNGTPPDNQGSAGETELDAEFSGMMAMGATVHVFASATNDDAGELQMFTSILDDNRAKVVNYSWGDCEPNVSAQHKEDMEDVFARAVAQGVNILVASGDSGAFSCGDGKIAADWPAAAPYVVSVGGTTFKRDKWSLAETAWSGSGGGVSVLWELPEWQAGLGGLFVKRSYPDVAFNADPDTGEAIYTGPPNHPEWVVIGGTSMSAPHWAGFLALVGESRQKHGKPNIGFLPPVLYRMSREDQRRNFHDVIEGFNGGFNAQAGWDAVTGFGSMRADILLAFLNTL